jgi:hypothetical protein
MYILPCTLMSFKISMSPIQSTRSPQRTNGGPRGGAPQFEKLCTTHNLEKQLLRYLNILSQMRRTSGICSGVAKSQERPAYVPDVETVVGQVQEKYLTTS